jgi:transposase-like protein
MENKDTENTAQPILENAKSEKRKGGNPFGNKGYPQRIKEAAVAEYHRKKKSIREIAETFKISTATLYVWVRQAETVRGLKARKDFKPGPEPIVRNEDVAEYFIKNPDHTLEKSAQFFKVSIWSISKKLKNMKFTRKKTFRFMQRDKIKEAAFIQKFKEWVGKTVIFFDESSLKNDLLYEYAYSLRGQPVFAEKLARSTEKITILSGLMNGKPFCPMLTDWNTDRTTIEVYLEEFGKVVPPGAILVMDNASFHKNGKIAEIAKKYSFCIEYLPPYCPHLNPIENFWKFLKIKARQFMTYDKQPIFEAVSNAILHFS